MSSCYFERSWSWFQSISLSLSAWTPILKIFLVAYSYVAMFFYHKLFDFHSSKTILWELHIVVLISPFHKYSKQMKGWSPAVSTKKPFQSWELSWCFVSSFYKTVLRHQKAALSHRVKLPIKLPIFFLKWS